MKQFLIFLLIVTVLMGGCIGTETPEPNTFASTEPIRTTESIPTPSTEETIASPTVVTLPETLPTTEPSTEPEMEPTVVLSLPEQLLLDMTIEEKVGQIFLARCPDRNAAAHVSNYHLGGYILFGRDFEDKTYADVCASIASYQASAKIPMLIAVDEEGGTVCRVSSQSQFRSSRFPSPRNLYDEGGLDLILSTEQEKIQLLQSFGINVNMAPVCDVTTNKHSFMYRRSLGQSPEITGQFVSSMVNLMHENAIGGVLKHFPGYGNNDDTHVGIAVDDRSLDDLASVDLVPFAAGIQAGADAILISHTFVNCLDAELPASLSPTVIGYLRSEMGFEGVVVTDDLVMEAITDLYGAGESAILAVLAGNDLLCSSEYEVQYTAVLEAVQTGRISEKMLNAAVLRVLNWKFELGLLDQN